MEPGEENEMESKSKSKTKTTTTMGRKIIGARHHLVARACRGHASRSHGQAGRPASQPASRRNQSTRLASEHEASLVVPAGAGSTRVQFGRAPN